jgi:hypothetical protein
MEQMGKTLLIIGLSAAAAGLLLLGGSKIPFLGKLPGDFRIEREHFSFYFPLATCLLLSAAVSLVSWLLQRK